MIRTALLSLAAAVALAFPAGAAPWAVDKTHSYVNFEVIHLGLIPFPGRFTRQEYELDYNPDRVEESWVKVRIPVKSLQTDDDLTNEILLGEQFFDSRNYPYITFESTGIRRTGPDTGVIVGELTMVGNTRTIEMPAKFEGDAKHPFLGSKIVGITAVAEIDRTLWGLSAWRPFVSKTITIEIGLEASPE